MLLIQKCLKFTLGHFCFLNTKLWITLRVLFRYHSTCTHPKKVSGIEFPHVIYFTYSSLGLIWQLSHYNYQKKKKESFFCTKCISIFPSQYKHSCEPITSKFKSWLFLSLASLENVEHHPGERLPGSVQRNFFLVSHFVSISSTNETHFLSSTIAFIFYIWNRVIIGICFAHSFEYMMW